jgi:beta-glucosidase
MSHRDGSGREAGEGGFPEDFLWGAATSACQVEGSPLADGAGPSIWHRFAHTPGCTRNGETPDAACDHYRRWPEDLEWMTRLGLSAYRFSLSWSRLLPEGSGRVNERGVAFYDRLIDALLERGITPNITLYHWDLPAALDDRGGWANRDSAEWFADYAQLAFERFGDRVPLWATHNEPWVVVAAGYVAGVHAPGHRNLYQAARAAHHLLLAHGAAVTRYREGGWPGRIGIVINLEPKDPASDDPADVAAAERADAAMNRMYLDPLFLGRPAEGLAQVFGDAWVDWPASDYERIRTPIDFLGINYYAPGVMRHDDRDWPVRASHVRLPDREYTASNWEVRPAALKRTLRWVRERYGAVPIYITENGMALDEPSSVPAPGLELADPRRVAYFREHLRALREAIAEDAEVRGYFAWSLLDNYEWSEGYHLRFGLLHVDFATQRRTPKASARFYRNVIRSRGAALDAPPEAAAGGPL